MRIRRWTNQETELLRKLYPVTPVPAIMKRIHRPRHAIFVKAFHLGLKRQSPGPGVAIPWKESDLQFLRENFRKYTNRELAERLRRKITLVRMKCYELGLRKIRMHYWTKEQTEFLRVHYRTMGDVAIADLFNRIFPNSAPWTKKHINKRRRYLQLHRTRNEIDAITYGNVSDKEVAGILAKSNGEIDHEMKREYLKDRNLISAKRTQLALQRTLKQTREKRP